MRERDVLVRKMFKRRKYMKRMKRFLLLVLFLLITTGCSVNPETNNDTSNTEDEIIHLNIQRS